MALQPQGYIPRLIDGQIETLLRIFGAVQIDGPKWCGKTWSGQAHANSMTSLDDQNVLPLAEADPAIALIGDLKIPSTFKGESVGAVVCRLHLSSSLRLGLFVLCTEIEKSCFR